MMPFRCLGLQKNILRPFQFSESFVRTKFPLTSDPGCLYVAPSSLHFFAFSPSFTSLSRSSELFAPQPVAFGFQHFAIGYFPTFGCGQQGHDFFAFSPSSTSRRMASGLVILLAAPCIN
jgi:hypothetical protein